MLVIFLPILWSLAMHSTLRHCGCLILLILCIYTTSFSQTPPTVNCYDCDTTGTLEGPYTTTFSVDPSLAGACSVDITYKKQTCGGITNMYITGYKIKGTTCSEFSRTILIERALTGFLSNSPPFPPFETTDPPAIWRVVKPTCWKPRGIAGDSLFLDPCPSAPCCSTYFSARNNNCGQIVTYIPFFHNTPVTCPPDTACTVSSCGSDPFDSWKKKYYNNNYQSQ